MASFQMLNDLKALKKHYVPDDKSAIIAYNYVVSPSKKHTVYFTAPKDLGQYPFLCNYKGHWQPMFAKMIVEK